MSKMGRPSKFKNEFIEKARSMCEGGATDIELADAFGVDISTLYRWKATIPEFREAQKIAKVVADERVERSLFARATGYEHPEVDIRVVDGVIVETPIRKFYPPDTTAAIFWLKNRQPEAWRDVKELKHAGSIAMEVPLDQAKRVAEAILHESDDQPGAD